MTQDEVNSQFAVAKAEWDKRVAESGLSDQMFVALDRTGFASEFIAYYQMAKENVESQGLTMPELLPGLSVTIAE